MTMINRLLFLHSLFTGFFKDFSGGYDASFWLSGTLITISAVLCYPLNYVKKLEMKRLEEAKKNGKSLA